MPDREQPPAGGDTDRPRTRTLTTVLAGFDEGRAARFRGLVLGELVRSMRAARAPGVVHLFLLPPRPGRTRFTLYETTQPINLEVPVPEAIRQVVEALHEAARDPRQVAGADTGWREVDAGADAFYLGSGARFAHPAPHGSTVARLVDHTALSVTLQGDPPRLALQASAPVVFQERTYPVTPDIPAVQQPPFVLIDTIVRFLR
ncbi:hypothetical protein FNH05_08630 [Amycolatopsis rhizosphaerae]|uniref:Uncharacterized protein n=1 Tax=Amycolatopsis rhizosphaerae TaxID=2053003 RepID=A0A558D5M6_9PSEU|nr:hypothetical protein [Amycolatopsis rhizosphaerae]TVT56299.1 hypothetical protein FNH05_08630 [Amycolatopsis rhizosphaerae]